MPKRTNKHSGGVKIGADKIDPPTFDQPGVFCGIIREKDFYRPINDPNRGLVGKLVDMCFDKLRYFLR